MSTVYRAEPAVKFIGRPCIWVEANSEEEAKARAERAVENGVQSVHQDAFQRMQEGEMNSGPRGRLVGDTVIVEDLAETDFHGTKFKAAEDELEMKKKRESPFGFTVIGYDVQKSARVRFTVKAQGPEDAVRKFMQEYADKNYVARSATNTNGRPIGELEEELGVTVVSCHEGYSTERVQEAVPYA